MNTSVALNTQRHTNRSSKFGWLRVFAVVGLIWYAFGLLQLWLGMTLDPAATVASGEMTAAHAAAVVNTPLIAWAGFFLASAGGLVGSVLLYLRSSRATLAFGASLASAAIYYSWIYIWSGTGGDRPMEEGIIAAVVVSVTAIYFMVSRRIR